MAAALSLSVFFVFFFVFLFLRSRCHGVCLHDMRVPIQLRSEVSTLGHALGNFHHAQWAAVGTWKCCNCHVASASLPRSACSCPQPTACQADAADAPDQQPETSVKVEMLDEVCRTLCLPAPC